MLSGLYPPTSGDAYIEGYSILDEMEEARESFGMCPQHDVLMDQLTVVEHLMMFATIKGASHAEAEEEVEKMLHSVGLVEKKNDFVKNLSGGQVSKYYINY
jgi:ABC-type multidrug transport system ATPase subunit